MLKNKTYSRYYFRTVVEIMMLAVFLLLSIGMVGAQTGTPGDSGGYAYTQDLSKPHSVFIQPEPDNVSETSAITIAVDPLSSTISIRDDATGGDCTLIGIWDISTKTCTLTTDLAETIKIDNDGITLNGNEHTITGSGVGNGVDLINKNHITIKNLIIENFVSGIGIYQSYYNNLIGNIILNNKDGITLFESNHNNLTNNTALNNSIGIYLYYHPSNFNNFTGNTAKNNDIGIFIRGHYNNFTSNIVSNNSDGFNIYYSANNTLKNNTISYNSDNGIFSDWGSYHNKFISNRVSDNLGPGLIVRYGDDNSFAENTVSNNSVGIIIANEGADKIFNNYFNNSNNTQIFYSSSIIWNIAKQPGTNIVGGPYLGGNFWAYPNGTGFSQTCTDADKDGICDAQYTLDSNNIDYLPLAKNTVGLPKTGDINSDGQLTLVDATYLAKHVGGFIGYETIYADGDINANGQVTLVDAIYLAKHVGGFIGYETIY